MMHVFSGRWFGPFFYFSPYWEFHGISISRLTSYFSEGLVNHQPVQFQIGSHGSWFYAVELAVYQGILDGSVRLSLRTTFQKHTGDGDGGFDMFDGMSRLFTVEPLANHLFLSEYPRTCTDCMSMYPLHIHALFLR